MKEKILNILTKIWAMVSFVLLFTGGISVFGYIAAIIIGGETGAEIINFLYTKLFSTLIYVNSIFIIVGLIKMELAGEQSLTAGKKKKKAAKNDAAK